MATANLGEGTGISQKPSVATQLLDALIAAAISTTKTTHSVDVVLDVLEVHIAALNLRGGIALLSEDGAHLTIRRVFATPELRKLLNRLAHIGNFNLDNFQIPSEDLPVYSQIIREGRALFLENSESLVHRIFVRHTLPMVHKKIREFSNAPGIYVPLVAGEKHLGVLNLVGDALTEDDISTVQALASQVANAMMTARLFGQMQEALRHARESEERGQWANATLKRQAAETTALLATAQSIATLDLDEVLHAIATQAQALVDATGSRIHLIDPDTRTLHCVLALHPNAEIISRVVLQLGEGFTGMVALTGEPELIHHTVADGRGLQVPGTEVIPESLILLPLRGRHEVIGVMTVIRLGGENPFSRDDIPLLMAFANQAAIAISNARLFDETQRQARELSSLYKITMAIANVLEMEDLMEQLYSQVHGVLAPDSYGVLQYDQSTGSLKVLYVVEAGARLDNLAGMIITSTEAGLTGWVVQNRQSLLIRDMQEDVLPVPPLLVTDTVVRSWLGVPLLVHDRLIGVITVQAFDASRFSRSDQRFLESLGAQIAISLENVRLLESERQQREQAETLREVALALNSALGREEVLDLILVHLARVVAYDSAAIMLAADQKLRLVGSKGLPLKNNQALELRLDDLAHVREVLVESHPVLIPDVHQDPRWVEIEGYEYIKTWMGIPLLVQGEAIGVLMLDKSQVNYYSQADVRLVCTFAHQASIIIENARLLNDARRRANELNALRATVTDISGELELAPLLRAVVERAVGLLDARGGELALFDAKEQQLRMVVSYQMDRDYTGAIQEVGQGAIGLAAQRREPIIVPDYASWAGRIYPDITRPWRSVMAAPLIFHSQLVGVIAVTEAGNRDEFTTSDLNLLNLFGQQAAIAIENARFAQDLASRLQETSSLYELARRVTSTLEMDEVLQQVVQMLQDIVNARGVVIALIEDDQLRIRASIGVHQDYLEAFDVAIGEQVSGQVAASGKSIYVPNVKLNEDLKTLSPEIHSLLVVPLQHKGMTIGTLSVDSKTPDAFTPYDERLLTIAAAQVSAAILNTQLYKEAVEAAERLRKLNQAGQEIAISSLDLEEIYKATHHAAARLMPSEVFAISVLDETLDEIEAVYLVDLGERSTPLWIPRNEGISGMVISKGATLRIGNFNPEVEEISVYHFGGDREVRSILAVPMRLGRKIIGMLSAQSYQRDAYSLEDQNALELIGAQAAIAIDNASLFLKVQTLAVTDGLTGIANRHALDKVLENEVARAHRYGHPVSLIFIDIDDFKKFNDQYGHPAGDERLKSIARLLFDGVRAPDFVARYGGEEFIVVLPHTPKAGAARMAERLRLAAEDNALAVHPELAAYAPGKIREVPGYTISLGVASFPEDASSVSELVYAADQAELRAKQQGKNQVYLA